MSGSFITVSINDRPAMEYLRQVEKRSGTLKPVMNIIGEIVTTSVKRNFEEGGRPNKWKPLAQSTQWGVIKGSAGMTKKGDRMRKWAQNRLVNKRVLIKSQNLMNSIHPSAGNDYVDVGTPLVYGAIHQFGGTIPAKTIRPYRKKALFWPDALYPVKVVHQGPIKIPARPYLMVQDEDWPKIDTTVKDYLADDLLRRSL